MGFRDTYETLVAEAYPVRHPVAARFSDLDPLRHINNVAVAEIFAEGRNAFMRSLFERIGRPQGLRFVVAQVGINYVGEAHYPGTFEIGSGMIDIGRSSLRLGQAFFQDGSCTGVAETVMVATRDHHSIHVPDTVRTALETLRLSGPAVARLLR